MFEIGSRVKKLPPPPGVVWECLNEPRRPRGRPWLNLLHDETEPVVLQAVHPRLVVWSSLWPRRAEDRVVFELTAAGAETRVRTTLITEAEPPGQDETDHMMRRLGELVGRDLRYSFGQ